MNHGGNFGPAKETNIGLLSRCEREGVSKISNGTCYFTAVKAPSKGRPWAVFLVLISQVRSLLKSLIVIDAKGTHIEWRIEDEAAGFRAEEPSAGMTERCVRLKSMQVGS